MKIYISADIEGVAGIADWDEADRSTAAYAEFRRRMTKEVAAAAEAALEAGATEIWVKDAHASGRNLLVDELPPEVRLIRGWSGHPLAMVQELDDRFEALLMIGYHACAGSGGNPLAHTMSSRRVARLTINDRPASEFLLHTWAAALHGVPVTVVTGDEALCEEVAAFDPRIRTVATMRGVGASTVGWHPARVQARIREAVDAALSARIEPVALPERFEVALRFAKPAMAYRASFYPGARLLEDDTIGFTTSDFFEVMRLVLFVV